MARPTINVVFGPAKYEKSQVTVTASGDAVATSTGTVKSVCVDHGGTFNDIPSDMIRGLRSYMLANPKFDFALPDGAPARLVQYLSRGIHLVSFNSVEDELNEIDVDVETEQEIIDEDEEENIDDGAQ
jgi:hypothetical protein